MELRQLRVFVAVAEEESFTAAADRLFVVQSAVSAAVRTLERELGVQLFARTTRRVALTDAGWALLPEARAVLAAAALAADVVDQVKGGVRGTVTLGIMQAWTQQPVTVAELIATFAAEHPLVEVSVRHVNGSANLAERVRDGGLDLAVLSLPDARAPGLTLTPLSREMLALACAPDHRLAERGSVALAELADEPFVETPPGWGLRQATDRAFAIAGCERRSRFEVNDVGSIVEFVRHGLAVALLPLSMTRQAPEVAMVALRDVEAPFDTLLAEPSNRRVTAAVRAFANTTRRLARS